MVLPTTYGSTVALLILAFIGFALWPNLFKRTQPGWRYELFALDFACGALILATVTAYTLGMFGAEMSFTDRMLVAGRTMQAQIFAAGVIFALGNMLLLPAISILGLAGGLPIVFGTALMMVALLHLRIEMAASWMAALIFVISCVAAVIGNRARRSNTGQSIPRLARGTLLGILGGLAIGFVPSIVSRTADPEFGSGPYATVLMLALGLLISTPVYAIFLMNIKVLGAPIGFGHYMQGRFTQHLPGAISGILWAAAVLAVLLASNVTGEQAPSVSLVLVMPALSIVIAILAGVFWWKELSSAPGKAKVCMAASALAFLAGLGVLAYV